MTEITDEMVERALEAYKVTAWAPPYNRCRDAMRLAIEAALNPKPEPEIEVTEGMIAAGKRHIIAGYEEGPQYYSSDLAALCRDMRAEEGAAYAAKDARQGASDARAEQTTGGGVGSRRMEGVAGPFWLHERANDKYQPLMAGSFPGGEHRRRDDPK